jgi:hypothetical protein
MVHIYKTASSHFKAKPIILPAEVSNDVFEDTLRYLMQMGG